ncbi:ABC transporter permease [Anaerotruncus sp. 80]|uniref:ABC transporter permease n=1 Tax=Anaerotruncus colihominis TaxID=169435 RepID=A0A845QH46_9FIRM|nr:MULTISPECIES: ABC transporter permease [Anaerotruncus]NBH61440.1 ABC transporter permease [Anaerotruncus colihominis]NCF02095.1 ABC transporter permease [Anaerotruncus sp. 80]
MNDIMRYIIKRLLIGILVVLFVTVLIFGIMQAMPGNPVDLMVDTRVSAEKVEEIKAEWGLDKPPVVQYFYWLGNILRGNFGMSISLKQNVSDLILQRLPYTLLLTGAALVIEYLLAIPLGLLAAVRKNKITDKALTITTVVLWSMPPFWLGVLLMLVFSIHLNILPLSGYSGFASLILPALTLSLPALAQIFRLTRSEVLDVMDEKYVTTAYAKGITDKKILVRHVLRNALIPVTVMFFLSLPWLIGGAVVVENVFAWPGMGQLLWKGIAKQDFVIVQGIVFVITILTVICNIIGDMISGILDPRIRLE